MRIKNINIIDLAVVIAILLIVFLSIKFYFIPKAANRPTYQIAVNDADGLIVGSSVLFGGKDVGHVSRLKFDDNQVIITFVIENDDFPKIPDGAEINVKSTGIAGSKALEIYYFPGRNKTTTVKEVIRQKESNNVQVTIAKQVINSANAITTNISDKQLLDLKNLTKDETITSNIGNILNKILLQLDKAQNNINKSPLKKINKKLESYEDADN